MCVCVCVCVDSKCPSIYAVKLLSPYVRHTCTCVCRAVHWQSCRAVHLPCCPFAVLSELYRAPHTAHTYRHARVLILHMQDCDIPEAAAQPLHPRIQARTHINIYMHSYSYVTHRTVTYLKQQHSSRTRAFERVRSSGNRAREDVTSQPTSAAKLPKTSYPNLNYASMVSCVCVCVNVCVCALACACVCV